MRPKGSRLAAVVICKNEEADLPGLMNNLLGWVDELVVVDDGSTDGSLELLAAAGEGVTVVHQSRNEKDGFAGLRNAGIDAAESDWLLHMDVDERVPLPLKNEVDAALSDDTRRAYRYRRLNFFLHRPMRWGGLQRWNAANLARRGYHRFEGVIHERCIVDAPPESIGQLSQPMWHLNDDGFDERLRKNALYAELEAQKLDTAGKRVRWQDLLMMPTYRAVRALLLERGFMDGVPGLIWALHSFTGTFNGYARAWDRQNSIPRQRLEEQLQKGAANGRTKS